jgi:superfamily II DNA or RNA helicase
MNELVQHARNLCEGRLEAYRHAPHDAIEHANTEQSVLSGGYLNRQITELIQNAADAISESAESDGRVVVQVDATGLWAANTGKPVDKDGVKALLNAHSSGKRDGQIGRFGLGFKSLLKLGGRVSVLSRSVALLFNPEESRRIIRAHLGLDPSSAAPGMRLATATTFEDAAAALRGIERFDWATTVVYGEVIRDQDQDALAEEMAKFPVEFLLFLSASVELELISPKATRLLSRVEKEPGLITLMELGGDELLTEQTWRVFQTTVTINESDALEDATHVHGRHEVPLIWALPIDQAREQAGRFYAFFPTQSQSRTIGIVNAPWKLNSDRTSVLPGAWNKQLMFAAANLILASIDELTSGNDPGIILDIYPRDLKNEDEVAKPLHDRLTEIMRTSAILPDCNGVPRYVGEIRRHPESVELHPAIIEAWARLVDGRSRSEHLHASCVRTADRKGRLDRLKRPEGRQLKYSIADDYPPLSLLEWTERVTCNEELDTVEVFRFLKDVHGVLKSSEWNSIRNMIHAFPTIDGRRACHSELEIESIAGAWSQLAHDFRANNEMVEIASECFRFDSSSDLRSEEELLDSLDSEIESAELTGDWRIVWRTMRKIGHQKLPAWVTSTGLKVRNTVGTWVEPDRLLLPGRIVPRDWREHQVYNPALADIMACENEHGGDADLLKKLGITDVPAWNWQRRDKVDLNQELQDTLATLERLGADDHRDANNEKWGARTWYAPPYLIPAVWLRLMIVDDVVGLPGARMFFEKIELGADTINLRPLHFLSRPQKRDPVAFASEHPAAILLCRALVFGEGPSSITLRELLPSRLKDHLESIPLLKDHRRAIEAVRHAAPALARAQVKWTKFFAFLADQRCDAAQLTSIYEAAAVEGRVPNFVPSRDGQIASTKVVLVSTMQEQQAIIRLGLVPLRLSPAAVDIWKKSGVPRFDDATHLLVNSNEIEPIGLSEAVISVTDVEPAMASVLIAGAGERFPVRVVEQLERGLPDGSRIEVPWAMDCAVLLLSRRALAKASQTERLEMLFEAGQAIGWIADDADNQKLETDSVAARRRKVVDQEDPGAKLLEAVGSEAVLEALVRAIVPDAGNLDPRSFGPMLIRMLGPSILWEETVLQAMRSRGLDPPLKPGGPEAAEFVAALGMPPEFAARPGRKLSPEEIVSGPVEFKPLHDYQEAVGRDIEALIRSKEVNRKRAVVSLPTGAGKTRVVAEAAIRNVLAADNINNGRAVVWIADSEELCEQAVQCFMQLWMNIGTRGQPLRVVRMWGSQPDPSRPVRDEPTVVVFSIQTFNARIAKSGFDWIATSGLLVIDECHHALTPSYTQLLKWFEERSEKVTAPILGLSATPFRGRSDDQTAQLARRFDQRLLPADQMNLFSRLQRDGVLAHLDYTSLEGATDFRLSPDEAKHIEQWQKLPDEAMRRLAADEVRNRIILDEIVTAPERSVLLFAASVDHARWLAASLNLQNVPASVIDAHTDRNSRRWFINRFQAGEIRVLCNWGTLTTGFDAPSIDLIVIARPVFSPSLFMQMVGRGLRGPKNGGKQRCRIVSLDDNLEKYSERLAHHYFEKHYV